MSDAPSNLLSVVDRDLLSGFPDITRPEPEQLYPVSIPLPKEDKKPSAQERLPKISDFAKKVIDEIERKKQQVDERCSRFSVSIPGGVGSPIFKAMARVFGERTTVITYDHYKRALEIRQQLVEADKEVIRKS